MQIVLSEEEFAALKASRAKVCAEVLSVLGKHVTSWYSSDMGCGGDPAPVVKLTQLRKAMDKTQEEFKQPL